MADYSEEFMKGFNLAKEMAQGRAQWCRENGESDMRSVIAMIGGLTPDQTFEELED